MAVQSNDIAGDKRADSARSLDQENSQTAMAPAAQASGTPANASNIIAGVKLSGRDKEVMVITYKCLKKTPEVRRADVYAMASHLLS